VRALQEAADEFRLDRTQGQKFALYIGVEKNALVALLESWFEDRSLPVLPLGGYASEGFESVVRDDEIDDGRPAVLIYAGDFDPSGEDISRDFIRQTDCWAHVHRIALTRTQVTTYDLPINPGKATDSRAAGFIARHGELMQVELDALPPDTLRTLYEDAINQYWDTSTYEAVLAHEEDERAYLARVAARNRRGRA